MSPRVVRRSSLSRNQNVKVEENNWRICDDKKIKRMNVLNFYSCLEMFPIALLGRSFLSFGGGYKRALIRSTIYPSLAC